MTKMVMPAPADELVGFVPYTPAAFRMEGIVLIVAWSYMRLSDEAMIALIHAVHFSQGTAGPETKNSSTAGSTVSPRNGRVINSQNRPLDISASECSQKKMPECII